jgi:hypothetical protein
MLVEKPWAAKGDGNADEQAKNQQRRPQSHRVLDWAFAHDSGRALWQFPHLLETKTN